MPRSSTASGGGPIHARVPIQIYPKQSLLNNKLQMYIINLMIMYDVVNTMSMKNYKSSRKFRVGLIWYLGVNWSTTTTVHKLAAAISWPRLIYRLQKDK